MSILSYQIVGLITECRDEVYRFVDKLFKVKDITRPDILFSSGYINNDGVFENFSDISYTPTHQIVKFPSNIVKDISKLGFDKDPIILKIWIGGALATEYSHHVTNYLNNFKLAEALSWIKTLKKEEHRHYSIHWLLITTKMEAIGEYVRAAYYRHKSAHHLVQAERDIVRSFQSNDLSEALQKAIDSKDARHINLYSRIGLLSNVKIKNNESLRYLAADVFQLNKEDIRLFKESNKQGVEQRQFYETD